MLKLRKKHSNFFLFSFVFFAFISSAQAKATSENATAYFALQSDPRTFNPVLSQETSSTAVLSFLFQGLTTMNFETGEVKPELAESWQSDDAKLVWTFFLRRDVKWSDGQPFTADDVVFTYNQLIFNDAVINSTKDILIIDGKKIKVEKVGNYTVRFTLPSPFAPFLRALAAPILPEHCLKESVQKKSFSSAWNVATRPSDIVGTGPFELSEYRTGERVILKRNPYYWKKSKKGESLPFLDRIYLLIVPSSDLALLKFKAGELDAVSLSARDFPVLKPLEAKLNFKIYDSGPTLGDSFLAFNQNPNKNPKNQKPYVVPYKLKWFQNQKFRAAISYAIDRNQMIQIVLNGLGSPQYSAMSSSSGLFFNPNVTTYDFNLEKSKRLLGQLGFKDGNRDGVLEDAEGRRLEFSLITNADNKERVDAAAMIVNDLQKIGVRVRLLSLEFNSIVSKLTSTLDWEAVILGVTGSVEPHFGANVWLSNGSLHFWYPRQNKPQTAWEARIDQLFKEALESFDDGERKKRYDEWQQIVAQQLPLIYTITGHDLTAVRNKFGNMKPTVLGGAFYNIDEIYLLDHHE